MASPLAVPARSTSMPTRLHPLPSGVEEELTKLKGWLASSSPSAEVMSASIECLAALYEWIDDLLRLPLVQQAIARLRSDKSIDELLDGYVKLLDACNTVRDTIVLAKDHVQDVRSALRRRGADMAIARDVYAYVQCRKKAKKEIDRCLKTLKLMENKDPCHLLLLDSDADLSMIANASREVRAISISIFRSLLSFLSTQKSTIIRKPSRWSLVSKAFIIKGSTTTSSRGGEEEELSELESVDASIYALHKLLPCKDINVEMVQLAQRRLEALEKCTGGLEAGVECIFRRLIQNRVSLLNVLSL